MSDSLTPKQRAFVDHYLKSGNATDAARQAGYSGSAETLRQTGSENLTKPHITAAIAAHQKSIASKEIADAQEVQELLTEIARDSDEDGKTRVAALNTLAKIHRLVVDRKEHDLGDKTRNTITGWIQSVLASHKRGGGGRPPTPA